MPRLPGRICLLTVAWLVQLLSLRLAPAGDEADLRIYFRQMRGHGLFQIAEEYALERMARADTTAMEKAILTVELTRVLASHAAEARSDREAAELWEQAEQRLANTSDGLNQPYWWGILARRATLKCDRATNDFWQYQLNSDSLIPHQAALASTRLAIETLTATKSEIETRLSSVDKRLAPKDRQSPTISPDSDQARVLPSSSERRDLLDELDHLSLRMLLNLAILEPTGADRAAALLEADRIGGLLSKRNNSAIVWHARLARAESQRHQGAPEKAIAYLKSLRTDDLNPEIVDAIQAEFARCERKMQRPDKAIQRILDYGQMREPIPNELRAILVECLLDSMHVAIEQQNSALAEELWGQAQSQRSLTVGPWRAYTDSLLFRAEEQRKYGDELSALVRTGRDAAQKKDWDTAIDAYQKAASAADQSQRLELVAEFLYAKGSIEIESHRWTSAIGSLGQFVERFPTDHRAADAHLLAGWGAMKRAEESPTPDYREAANTLLRAHLQLFPNSSTRHEASWYLAIEAIRKKAWSEAVEYLTSIPADHHRGAQAAAQLPDCLEQALLHSDDANRSTWQTRSDLILSGQLAIWPQPPAGWTLEQSENGWRWAKLLLQFEPPRYAEAEKILEQILHSRDVQTREHARDSTPLPAGWDRIATGVTQLRVISLAGLGEMGEAETLFHSATTSQPAELLALLSGLSDLSKGLDDRARNDLGRIQLAAARRLVQQRETLPEAIRESADRCLAEAYVATGDLPEAIEIYESLLQHRPNNKALLQTIATLSLDRGQPENLKRAKSIYRKLESGEPAGTDLWLRYRLTIARITLRQGDVNECQKLIKVTRILYPNLGGDELKAEFDHLSSEANAAEPTKR